MNARYEEVISGFRDAMASVCSPVSVVTALDGDRPHGTTLSAFMSLSLHPPMIALAFDRGSELLAVIERSRRFGVNVLADGQGDLAAVFARKGHDKFDGVPWLSVDDAPQLPDSAAWLGCYVAEITEGGDHVIVQGAVRSTQVWTHPPLTYHARTFGTHAAQPLAATG